MSWRPDNPKELTILGLLAVILLMIVSTQIARANAKWEAATLEGQQEVLLRQREVVEDQLQDMLARYTAQGDSLIRLQRAVDETSTRMASERQRAAALSRDLETRVEAAAADSATVVALVDSIVAAKDAEIYSLEVRLGVTLTELTMRRERDAERDAALQQSLQANELLHLEIAVANSRADAWKKAATRGSLQKWGERILAVGAIVLVGR